MLAWMLKKARVIVKMQASKQQLDGAVSASEQSMLIGRKKYPTQKIMVVYDWNMCFTFVLADWECTAHDQRRCQEPDARGSNFYTLVSNYNYIIIYIQKSEYCTIYIYIYIYIYMWFHVYETIE